MAHNFMSICRILKNVPLDMQHDMSVIYSSRSAQAADFAAYAVYTENNLQYVRISSMMGTIQLNITDIETVQDANYLMFQNTAYSDKWYYAFIINTEYISDSCVRFTFYIDVMQTWLAGVDYDLNECFIEREHTSSDLPFEHYVDEGIEFGEYTVDTLVGTGHGDMSSKIFVVSPYDEQGNLVATTSQRWLGYTFSGLYIIGFDTFQAFCDWIDLIGESKFQATVAIFNCHKDFQPRVGSDFPPTGWVPESGGYDEFEFTNEYQFNVSIQDDTIGSYTIRNQKLRCYPYSFIHIANGEGNSADYRYEFFNRTNEVQCPFTLACQGGVNSEIMLVPNNYKNCSIKWDESLTMQNTILCAWASDTYKAWLAQNKNSLTINALSSAMSALGSVAQIGAGIALAAGTGGLSAPVSAGLVANGASGMMSVAGSNAIADGNIANGLDMASQNAGNLNNGVRSALSTMAMIKDKQAMPAQAHGTQTSDVLFNTNNKDFQIYKITIPPGYAKRLDSFFDMYGYKVLRFGEPHLTSRPSYNFIKTVQCNATGSVPFNAMSQIKNIYNNGICFWKSLANVGNYSLANRPT